MPSTLRPVAHSALLQWAGRLFASSHGRLSAAARLLVTALLIWVVLRSIDTGAVFAVFDRATPIGLGLAALVVAAQFIALVWRWQLVVLVLTGWRIGLCPLAGFLGQSFLIGQVLPSSVGGDVARAAMLARRIGTASAARSVVCDRLLGFAGLGLFVLVTAPVIAGMMGGGTPFLTLTLAALGTMAALALVLMFPMLLRTVPWLERTFATVARDLRLTLRSGKTGLAVLMAAALSNLLAVLLIYVLGVAIGAGLKAEDCLVLVPPAMLVSALPISLGGWGVREEALLAAFRLVHANPANVVATSLMFGLTTPLVGAVTAAIAPFAGWSGSPPRRAADGR
jgi:hypothetical protein